MPSVAVKLYSVFFKFLLKHRLQSRIQKDEGEREREGDTFGVTSRPEESIAAANPSFSGDGVATKDIHIDPLTSLSVRIFLPDTCLNTHLSLSHSHSHSQSQSRPRVRLSDPSEFGSPQPNQARRNSYAVADSTNAGYKGYLPSGGSMRKLPVMIQFHGGGFVSGSNDSVANDLFCKRIAKLCDVIVLGVGYRLAPENRYPAAFEDGLKVLHWLGKQANLAECGKSLVGKKPDVNRHVVDAFGASMVEPWLAAHGDPLRLIS